MLNFDKAEIAMPPVKRNYYSDPENGAHFKFDDMCQRLIVMEFKREDKYFPKDEEVVDEFEMTEHENE